MSNRFSYSFDRESFTGRFETREQAVAAGMKAAAARPDPVEAVYVARSVPVDPQADGHAERVVEWMRVRMLDRTGDGSYLANVDEHQLADLDASIEHAIVEWLKRHGLEPACRYTAISEHPLPLVHAHAPHDSDEVSLIGPEE